MAARFQRGTVPQVPGFDQPPALDFAAALEGFGRQVEGFVGPARNAAVAADVQSRIAAGESPGLTAGLTETQRVFNDTARQAYATRAGLMLRQKVSELSSEYDGRQPDHPEAFRVRFDEYAQEVIKSVPEQQRGQIEQEVALRRSLAMERIVGAAKDHELRRNVATLNDGLKADLDDALAAARDGRDDVFAAVVGRATERGQELVRLGVWSPEQAAMAAKDFAGQAEAEAIFGDYTRGAISLSPEAIMRGEGVAAGLDTGARDRLASKVSGLISRRQADAAHARAVREAEVRENTRQVKALAERRRLGVRGTPEDEALEAAVFEGRVAVDPEAFDSLRAAATGAHLSTLVTSSSVSQAEAALAAMEAEGAADVVSAETLADARELVGKHRAGLRGSDPVQYLSGIGALSDPDEAGPPPPLAFDSPDALVATLTDRKRRIAAASEQYGEPLPSMTQAEVSSLRRRLDTADLDTRLGLLGAIAAVEGPQADRTIAKLAESGAEQYAIAGSLAAKGLAEPARDVLAAGFIDSKTKGALLKPEGASSTVLADFEAEAGPMYRHDPENAALHLRAAQDLYASRAFRQGLAYDPNEFRRAVRDVVGGTQTIETGGTFGYGGATSVVPATPGVDWSSRVASLTGRDIQRMGGTNLDARLTPDGVAKLVRETGAFRYTPEGLRVVVQLSDGEAELAMPDGQTPFVLRP